MRVIDFSYYNPTTIIFGKDKISLIGKEIKKRGYEKVLFVYGQGSIKRNGVYDKVIDSLKENSIDYTELSGIRPNPELCKVEEGVKIAKNEKVDAVLAVGGGSVIDSAKGIAAGVFSNNVWNLYDPTVREKVKNALPIFVVLTISGTGSECNGGSVLTNEKTKEKSYFVSRKTFPLVSIIDPSIQSSVPDYQLKCTSSDIICHVMEQVCSKGDISIVDKFAIDIIDNVMEDTIILLKNRDDYDARANYALSSMFALNGLLSIGKTGGDWTTHYIEHAISGLHPEIPHGAGLSVILPAFLKFIYPYIQEKLDYWAQELWGVKGDIGIDMIKEWYEDIGLPVKMEDLKIEREEYDKIAEFVIRQSPVGDVKEINKEDLYKILYMAE